MAEFTIRGALCKVVPEEGLSAALAADADGDGEPQVVGSCLLEGRRYLVVCLRAPSDAASECPCLDLLTRRELQVALMVCQGRCNKQIAHQLHLSEWTVSSYMRRIYAKLGVRTRAAMAAKLMSCTGNGHTLQT